MTQEQPAATPGTLGQSEPPPPPPEQGRGWEKTFEDRMEGFGREAEAAGQRWAKDPNVVNAADTAARVWGLLVLAVGVWFFLDITLAMDMPAVPWRDLWPLVLIVIGVAVVVRGMARRRT